VFERLRSILHNSDIEKRVQYMVEVMFAIRKDKFKDHPSVVEELDVVDESDQITHLLRLEEAGKTEDILSKS
ncbi:pre-mRNA-splicing factor CWC22 homolog, partial [Paramuricea clavata]